MRLVVLSDTHVRRGGRRRLPDAAYAELQRADAILHAGDIVVADLLHELEGFAPTFAVLGNNDDAELAGLLPETRVEVFDGLSVGMIHDSGASKGRPARLRRRFPECGLVVYGHSHIPFDGEGDDGQHLFNPGSPTDKRRQPDHTLGLVDVVDGRIDRHRIVVLD